MSIVSEYENAARTWFRKLGIDESQMTQDEAIAGYLTIRHRLVPVVPRKVSISSIFQGLNLPEAVNIGIEMLRTKIEAGEEVTGHLTRRVLDPRFNDKLFLDWGIQHLHLSNDPHPKNKHLFASTEAVLFVMFTESDAYFIDVGKHSDIKHNYFPFAERELLQIVADEWPCLLEGRRIPDAAGLTSEVQEAKEIHQLRNAGGNVIHRINGNCYMPANGGMSTAGTSVAVRRQVNEIYYSDEEWIDARIQKRGADAT